MTIRPRSEKARSWRIPEPKDGKEDCREYKDANGKYWSVRLRAKTDRSAIERALMMISEEKANI